MQLRVGERTIDAELIVFDKDGTLVDLHAPWGSWVETVSASLSSIIPPDLFLHKIGWRPEEGRIAPETPLAIASKATLQAVVATWLYDAGKGWSEAMALAGDRLTDVEAPPAPALCPLSPIFEALKAGGAQLAVVSTDDRAGVERDLGYAGVLHYLDVIIGGDSATATKPAPDMALAACAAAGVLPGRTVVVGDSVADMWMAHAAGVALAIGVLSGASTREVLAPHADLLLPSVAEFASLLPER